jgi:hypothetical protein
MCCGPDCNLASIQSGSDIFRDFHTEDTGCCVLGSRLAQSLNSLSAFASILEKQDTVGNLRFVSPSYAGERCRMQPRCYRIKRCLGGHSGNSHCSFQLVTPRCDRLKFNPMTFPANCHPGHQSGPGEAKNDGLAHRAPLLGILPPDLLLPSALGSRFMGTIKAFEKHLRGWQLGGCSSGLGEDPTSRSISSE